MAKLDTVSDTGRGERPDNREVENENMKATPRGQAPRPATEPAGGEASAKTRKTKADPGSGKAH